MSNKLKTVLGAALITALVLVCCARNGEATGPSTATMEARVAAVAAALEKVTGQKAYVVITPDASRNAFVLPDETIVISSGLVSECATDDELAFVMAHELSHISSKDHVKGQKPGLNGTGRRFPRQMEINADRNAAAFMAAAGFDPGASIKLIRRLAPEPDERISERLGLLMERISGIDNQPAP